MHQDFSNKSCYLDLSQDPILYNWWVLFNVWGCINCCTFQEIYRYIANCEELIFVGASVALIITVSKISDAGTEKAADLNYFLMQFPIGLTVGIRRTRQLASIFGQHIMPKTPEM
jgi:hypothetical protein